MNGVTTLNMKKYILAGDIGGTKTTLGIYPVDELPCPALYRQQFTNAEAKGLDRLIDDFLRQTEISPSSACFGVAGPVLNNQVRMTNLNWFIDGAHLKEKFAFKQVKLINDLAATAMGAVILPENNLSALNRGNPVPGANIAVIAPGTGLGEAFVLQRDNKYFPQATEGGHASFAPRNNLQIELLQYLLSRQSHVSEEQVCSGMGLPVLYDFLTSHFSPPPWLAEQLDRSDDKTPVIVNAALGAVNNQKKCDIAINTLQLFVDILAAETANLALKTLATGGIFIGGGIIPRILSFLDSRKFMTIFCRGIYREMLNGIPIHIITNQDTALLGAAVSLIQSEKL